MFCHCIWQRWSVGNLLINYYCLSILIWHGGERSSSRTNKSSRLNVWRFVRITISINFPFWNRKSISTRYDSFPTLNKDRWRIRTLFEIWLRNEKKYGSYLIPILFRENSSQASAQASVKTCRGILLTNPGPISLL